VTKGKDVLFASIGEGFLVLTVAAIGLIARMPLIFTSLGPTAYELVEKPNARSARLYNVIVGHMVALGAGFLSLWVLNAWAAPKVASAGFVSSPRLLAAVLSVVITTALTLLLGASQPASLSTTLLVSLGSMQKGRDAIAIALAVFIMAAIGEPVRRLCLKAGVGQP
jgi:CBS domain-containing membrane protein